MDHETEEFITESLKSALDSFIYTICRKAYPHKIIPSEWYKPGGIYEKMVYLINEIQS